MLRRYATLLLMLRAMLPRYVAIRADVFAAFFRLRFAAASYAAATCSPPLLYDAGVGYAAATPYYAA